MTTILYVGPVSSFGKLLGTGQDNDGTKRLTCADEQEAMQVLTGGEPITVIVVSAKLVGSTALSLIRSTRMLPHRAIVPIACVTDIRDLNLAQSALRAGATEVFLSSDTDSIIAFVGDCVVPVQADNFTGRVLLAEDCDVQTMVVSDLCGSLGLSVDRVSTVEDGLERLKHGSYQAVIIDVVLLGLQSGLSLLRQIRQPDSAHCNVAVLVVSGFEDRSRRVDAFRAGADDYMSKPFFSEEFVWRLRRIIQSADEAMVISPASVSQGIEPPTITSWQQRGLSPRESAVCERVLLGMADKDIATELGISFWTVRTHLRNTFTKLGLLNRRELLARYQATSDGGETI